MVPGAHGPRMVVLGTTGSGKTTLARRLAELLGVPHIELDALHWEPGWTPAATEVFRRRTAAAVEGNAWVVDGNYGVVRDLVWARAEVVVWLDYPLRVVMARLLRRTLRRIVSREELWNGNRERARTAFLSRDSLFVWALQTYWRRRREYPVLFAQPEYSQLQVVRLASPAATRAWLDTLSRRAADTPGCP